MCSKSDRALLPQAESDASVSIGETSAENQPTHEAAPFSQVRRKKVEVAEPYHSPKANDLEEPSGQIESDRQAAEGVVIAIGVSSG